jgi:hypothetical protein
VSAADAAAGVSLTPAGAVKLQQLPVEYVALFVELLVLSMQPNAGVRGSAMPTLQSCVKRFPCLVEVMLPEVLAALAGVEGPLLHSPRKPLQQGLGEVQGLGASGGLPMPGSRGTGQQLHQQDVGQAEKGVVLQLPTSDELEHFYGVTLIESMKSEKADAADAAGSSTGQASAAAGGAAAAAAALTAAAAAAAKAATSIDSSAAAAAATAAAAAAAAAAAGSRSVAAESVNDGRVAGACAVLAQSLDAWRVIFRDRLVFRAFVAALMASRCHSSNTCLKSIQMLIMQVSRQLACSGRGGGGPP